MIMFILRRIYVQKEQCCQPNLIQNRPFWSKKSSKSAHFWPKIVQKSSKFHINFLIFALGMLFYCIFMLHVCRNLKFCFKFVFKSFSEKKFITKVDFSETLSHKNERKKHAQGKN